MKEEREDKMAKNYTEDVLLLLKEHGSVYVNDLSLRLGVSKVSIRKYLASLEQQGKVQRFYGGATLIEAAEDTQLPDPIYRDPLLVALAQQALSQIADGDSIFIGSGRTCCVLAHLLQGLKNLTVVTNNITALPELIKNVQRVYLIGGEVTSTDAHTYFSSWESPQSLLGNIFVSKAFTSTSGLDMRAGLTVDSIISTYIFKQIPTMAQHWYLLADSSKFDKVAIYQVAELDQIQTLITDTIPERYRSRLTELQVEVILIDR